MKTNKIGFIAPPISKALRLLGFLIIFVSLESCSKDYYPKQFPPVQSCPDLPVVMYGGEEYPTVLIDNRCWLAKNLNIGIMIHDSIDMTDNNVIEKYCYKYDTANCKVFGGLYQWDEVMQYKSGEGSRGICPEGWHIPTNRDFVDLVIYHDNYFGYLIDNKDNLWKEHGQSEIFNLTGFSALPSGLKRFYFDFNPTINLYYCAYFWSSKEFDAQNVICLRVSQEDINIDENYYNKKYGLSIRCVKDE